MSQSGPSLIVVVVGNILTVVLRAEYTTIKAWILEPFRRRTLGNGWTPGQDDR
jgi:hypothetical protein